MSKYSLNVLVTSCALLSGGASAAHAEATLTVLYDFANGGGFDPNSVPTIDASGALYGTLATTSVNGQSAVYKLTPPAAGQTSWTESTIATLKNFQAYKPYGGVIFGRDGNLYGMTKLGGSQSDGTVFELEHPTKAKPAWTVKLLYKFTGATDGKKPVTGLSTDATGALYGMTSKGNTGTGATFALKPPAGGTHKWTETNILGTGGSGMGGGEGRLVEDAAGNLYGTSGGTVFKLTPPATQGASWTSANIYTYPQCTISSLAIDAEGALYATSGLCQAAIVFKLTPPSQGQSGWSRTDLYNFNFPNSGDLNPLPPSGNLVIDSSSAIYGISAVGGANNFGMVFKLTPPPPGQTAWTESTYYSSAGTGDGQLPGSGGLMIDSNDSIYYANNFGGGARPGIVVELSK